MIIKHKTTNEFMRHKDLTAIYFCEQNGQTDTVDISELRKYTGEVLKICVIWQASDIPLDDMEQLAGIIRNNDISRIVIAGTRPGILKPYFANALSKAGRDSKSVILASFMEHGAIRRSDTQKAKAILRCAVNEIYFSKATTTGENDLLNETLVLGGGIAGIQASLEIANGNQKVYLVECTGTIGGHMAMFDKTFPTLDCAACILTPKMVEVGQHPNIELMTYCEVIDVKGEPGNYTVIILKKARKVNPSSCIGCGTCSEKCPAKAPSEFDANTTLRKAIYIPFPQAVPNKYLVDDNLGFY